MKAFGAALAMIGLTASTPALASMTIREYLKVERGEMQGVDPALNVVYVWGVMDALGAFDEAIRQNLGQTLFCAPAGAAPLDVEEFKVSIDREIENARTEVVDFESWIDRATIGTLGLEVLSEVYDCRKK